MPEVSIIIPTHNRAKFLPRAVETAQQAGTDVEIIVVDDGSTDHTADLCESLSRIRYIRLASNQGLAAARNAGIRSSSAEFVAFVDDDDLRLPGSIDRQVRALRHTRSAALCHGSVLLADAKRRLPTGEIFPLNPISGDIFWNLLEGTFLCLATVVARRQILFDCGLFDENLKKAEDWDLWLRVTEKWPVISINEPVAIYRQAAPHSEQLCSDTVSLFRQMLTVQEVNLRRPRAAAAPYWKRRRARSRLVTFAYDALVSQAEVAMGDGDSETGIAKLHEARRLRPLRARTDRTLRRLLRAA